MSLWGRLRFRAPLRLRSRIAAAMLIALLAMQALNAAMFYLLASPKVTVFSARWLVEKSEQAATAIFSAETAGRERLAHDLSSRPEQGLEQELHIFWRPHWEREPPQERHNLFLVRLLASLESALAGKARRIKVNVHPGPPGFPDRETRSVPPDFLNGLSFGPIAVGEADIPMIGQFKIAIQGLDESWIFIEPAPHPRFGPPFDPLIVTTAAAMAIIAILSIWTARMWLRPLDHLAEAAERLGRTREMTPIDTGNLQDFQVIGEAFNSMQTRIKRFIDERTQMLAAISHDLRTPLTRMRLAAEELADTDIRERMIANAEEMESMISATLAFAAGDFKGERQETVDLAALLISLCDDFSDHGLKAEYHGPDHAFVRCQPTAMKRALVNLMSNAVKYGREAQVRLRPHGGDMITTIADCGPGIPPDKMELAFQPFRRLEGSRSRETGGVGLGLAIARDIVQSHGGDIELSNRIEGGLQALVRLPATAAGA
jgi:signal transduction histidine kinase